MKNDHSVFSKVEWYLSEGLVGIFTSFHLVSCLLVGHARVRCHPHGEGLPQQNTKAPDVTL